MNHNLFKFYIFFVITLFIFINIFPSIFINTKNTIDYLKIKTLLVFNDNKSSNLRIYDEKGNVIIMFDDGWKTQYTIAYQYMNEKGIRGSIGVIPSAVGEEYYMNLNDLYKLNNSNWDLLNHTYNHIILTKESESKQLKAIEKGSNWLYKIGFNSNKNILIYPEGEFNADTIKIMGKLNYISARGINEGFNMKKPDNLFDIKIKNVISNITPETVYEWINYTINNNMTLVLLFHKLQDNIDNTNMKYKINDFYKIIDYIDSKRNNLNIITYSEWIEATINN